VSVPPFDTGSSAAVNLGGRRSDRDGSPVRLLARQWELGQRRPTVRSIAHGLAIEEQPPFSVGIHVRDPPTIRATGEQCSFWLPVAQDRIDSTIQSKI
jgi:hypothetical protein